MVQRMDRHLIIEAILRLVPPCGVEASRARANLERLDEAAQKAMEIKLAGAVVTVGGDPRRAAGTCGPRRASGRLHLAVGFSKPGEATRLLTESGGIRDITQVDPERCRHQREGPTHGCSDQGERR